MSKSRMVSFRFSEDLVSSIDGVRGDVSRNEWVVRALEVALAGGSEDFHSAGVEDRVWGYLSGVGNIRYDALAREFDLSEGDLRGVLVGLRDAGRVKLDPDRVWVIQ